VTTDYPNDGGFDVIVYRECKETYRGEPAGLIQVKHQSDTVGAPTVQKIVGATVGEGFLEAWGRNDKCIY